MLGESNYTAPAYKASTFDHLYTLSSHTSTPVLLISSDTTSPLHARAYQPAQPNPASAPPKAYLHQRLGADRRLATFPGASYCLIHTKATSPAEPRLVTVNPKYVF